MTKLTDGKRTVEIKMTEGNYTDISQDFFEVGGLPVSTENYAYIVNDVDYCIDQAKDWQQYKGDYRDDELMNNNELYGIRRQVFVFEL